MKITTNRGQTFNISHIWPTTRAGSDRIMIETDDDRPIHEIAAAFNGVQTFEKTDEKKPDFREIISGYTRLVNISDDNFDGVTRLILAKGEKQRKNTTE